MAGAPKPRLVVGLGVIAFHVALYLLLRGSVGAPVRQAGRPTQLPATLRLLPWRPAPAPPATTETQATSPERPHRAAAAITATVPSTPALPATSPALTQADAAPLPALPASQPPRPLDLSLPRGFATRPTHATRRSTIRAPTVRT